MTERDTALADLAELQNRLTELLLAEPRDLPAIIEAADAVRRAERQAPEGRGKSSNPPQTGTGGEGDLP